MDSNYKRTVAGSVGAGMGAIFNGSGRKYYILEHKTESKYHHIGESQKIIIDQVELGRGSSCQVRFGDDFPTVSHKHAAIVKNGEGWKLVHLSQTNNTYVNGQPVPGECILNSGDEIRLSSNGPVMGFIVPQGAKSVVSSIGLTERMNLFRQQALRPYKTALTILGIVLLAAIGALLFTMKDLSRLQKEHIDLVGQYQELVLEKEDLQSQMDNLADKNSQEYKALEVKLHDVQAKAAQTEKKMRETENRIAKKDAEEAEAARQRAAAVEQETKPAAEPVKDEKVEENSSYDGSSAFADIKDCYEYVFYVRMDDLEVYNPDGGSVAKFETSGIVGGTGFLLENGIFATACRVVEPWFYYKGKIGEDQKGRVWTFEDIQTLSNLGFRIKANYTASSSEYSFKFDNSEVRNRADLEYSATVYTPATYFIDNKTLRQIINKKEVTLYWHSTYAASDWATFKPNVTKGGLRFDNTRSLNPVREDVSILGFPKKEGFTDSQSINPQIKSNAINTPDLNKYKIIELSSERYEVGNDGSPVLVLVDGVWTVIGILSHTDDNGRDYVVPIAYLNN